MALNRTLGLLVVGSALVACGVDDSGSDNAQALQRVAQGSPPAHAPAPSSTNSGARTVTETTNSPVDVTSWPTETDRPSALESAISVPGSTMGAFKAYLQRAASFVSLCMREGGFDYEDGDPVLDGVAAERLVVVALMDGIQVSGGCDAWGPDMAFPGHYFGQPYQAILEAATTHPDYLNVVAAYDSCLIDAGYPDLPDLDGVEESEIEDLMNEYTAQAAVCDSAAGLVDAQRALDIYVGDRFYAEHADAVDRYVTSVLSRIVETEEQ